MKTVQLVDGPNDGVFVHLLDEGERRTVSIQPLPITMELADRERVLRAYENHGYVLATDSLGREYLQFVGEDGN